MTLDVRHSTAQRATQVQYLGSDGGERFIDPLGEVCRVCGQGDVHCVLRYRLVLVILVHVAPVIGDSVNIDTELALVRLLTLCGILH